MPKSYKRPLKPVASALTKPSRLTLLLVEARWLLLTAATVYTILVLGTYAKADPGWSHSALVLHIHNVGGKVGAWLADVLLFLFGFSAWWWSVLLIGLAWKNYQILSRHFSADAVPLERVGASQHALGFDFGLEKWVRGCGFALIMIGSMGLEDLRLYTLAVQLPYKPGGILGAWIAAASQQVFGFTGGTLVLLFALTLGVSLFFHVSWLSIAEKTGAALERCAQFLIDAYNAHRDRKAGQMAAFRRQESVLHERFKIEEALPIKIATPITTVAKSERVEKERQAILFTELSSTLLPPLSLLDSAPAPQESISIDTLEFTSRLIEKKLSDFGVEVKVIAAYPGPVITRYEIEPAVGVKGSQIVNLARDLARSLSLISIRVVETIPGKNCMGLELPNPQRQIVRLTEILSSKIYNDSGSSLTLALGKDIAGNPVIADLTKMPHLLIAGTTGSGKSVGINATVLSLLYKADPQQVRLILIDPKMLEMSVYEGIPHLLAPVVTDMRQAAHALNWAVSEMERRYQLMSKLGVRNIAGYNHKIIEAQKQQESIPNPFSLTPDAPEPLEKMALIVIVIDELADLMMVVGKKIEELIARIAQKARAAGIHLILATQRPSVDVITGLIKANIPTRIAFQVSSKIDSRTILDQMGAETLLGMGDMLYLQPGGGVPTRVHGAFVSDDEVHRVVDYLRQQGAPNYIEGILEGATEGSSDEIFLKGEVQQSEADVLYDQAVQIVLSNRRASISLVQRHLRVGYNRAARLLEQMEKSGLVSAMQGNGNREILVPMGE